jgi:hypothetical protein
MALPGSDEPASISQDEARQEIGFMIAVSPNRRE